MLFQRFYRGVFCEDFVEHISCSNGTTMYSLLVPSHSSNSAWSSRHSRGSSSPQMTSLIVDQGQAGHDDNLNQEIYVWYFLFCFWLWCSDKEIWFPVDWRNTVLWWDQDSKLGLSGNHLPADWMPSHKPIGLWMKSKNLNSSKHPDHLIPLPELVHP